MKELFLQILGAGRNDHALARSNHRHEVSQSLAGSGAGFDDQMALSSSACSTACAICSCPRRNSYAGCVCDSTPPGAKNW